MKPENILIDSSFEPFLIDFGCSNFMDERGQCRYLVPIGSPAYMPPERTVYSTATDVYTLGHIYNFVSMHLLQDTNEPLLNLIEMMLQQIPPRRPTIIKVQSIMDRIMVL